MDSHRDREGIRILLGKVTDIAVDTTVLDTGRSAPAVLGTLNFADADVNPDA